MPIFIYLSNDIKKEKAWPGYQRMTILHFFSCRNSSSSPYLREPSSMKYDKQKKKENYFQTEKEIAQRARLQL